MVNAGGFDGPESQGSPLGHGHFFDEDALGCGGGDEFLMKGFEELVEEFGGFAVYEDGSGEAGFFVARASGIFGVFAVRG